MQIEVPEAEYVERVSQVFEVHKTYRFNVGGGVMWSGLGDSEFAVRSTPRLDGNGNEIIDTSGNVTMDDNVFQSGHDDNRTELALTFTYYLGRELDLFPGRAALRPTFGISLGLGLDKPDENLFFGGVYQPTLGVQFLFGFHLGKVTVLQDGISPGQVLPSNTMDPPTRRKWETEPFIGIVFDSSIFERLFGR